MDNITTPAFLRSELEEIGFDVIHVVLDGAAGARSTNAVATFRVPEDLVLATEPLPPAAETGARGDDVTWGVHPTQRELEAYGDGYAAGMLDGPEYAPLKNEIADLERKLAAARAALRELELHREFVDTVRKAIDNTPQDARLPIIQAALNKFDVKLEVLTEIVQATATEA